MERGSKNKFKMKSAPLRAEETIAGRFMAMGRSLGNSKTSNPVAIDPSKYYEAPKKKVANEDDTEAQKALAEKKAAEKKAKKSIKGLNYGDERRKKESEVNDYVIPTAEETLNLDPKKEMKLDTSNNLQQTYMSAMSAFPMKYGRKK
tara:strand:+ start:43 stop:483 length:441 start_codon:yes stop_codon:yes gene_type:complete